MIDVKELTIFDHLHNVFVTKIENRVSQSDSFPFYMIQRWGSMHSSAMTLILNESVNCRYKAMLDSKMEYDLLRLATPRLKSSKFKYIKKKEKEKVSKKAKDFTKEDISLLCKILESSEKDILLMIQFSGDEMKKIINNTEVLKGKKIK